MSFIGRLALAGGIVALVTAAAALALALPA
jgi:hypothetical protein